MGVFALPPLSRIAIRLAMIGLAALTLLLVCPGTSQAHWRDHYYWRAGWGWAPYPGFAPYPYPYPYYEYPPAYAYPAPVVVAPQVQVVTPPSAAVPQTQMSAPAPDSYYYCKKPKGYYPYVQNCKVGWTMVPTTPPTGKVGP